MVTNPELRGKKILVTRPEKQSSKLIQLIQSVAGEAISFPVITVRNLPKSEWQMVDIAQQDWLVFTSTNAVNGFYCDYPEHLSFTTQIAAVGQATATALRLFKLNVSIQPMLKGGSEGLLELPAFQQVSDQKITIIRGRGGRELLADTLSARGATISYIEVYERIMPTKGLDTCKKAIEADYILCTSNEGVTNLCQLLLPLDQTYKTRPLIVLSDRIRLHAQKYGFTDIYTTQDTSDEAILDCLMEINKNHGE